MSRREFPIMPGIVEMAERFYEAERNRIEWAYERGRRKQPKIKRQSIEERLAEKRRRK